MNATPSDAGDRALSLTRVLDAPRGAIWRAWTEPDLLKQWFCPKPWGVSHAELDVRPGGANYIVMQGPNGEVMPNRGVYLEVVEGEKLVFTDAYTEAWLPAEKPFMTATITLADEGGRTRYTARVRHWTVEDRETHEKMGFHEGWGLATDQLEALARSL